MTEDPEIVATGTWLYDGIIAMPICVRSKPAHLHSSRYDGDDELDDSRPIPVTANGLVYTCYPGGGEGLTLEEAKASADAQPWGPVSWD